jgi:hypothetical protein
VSPIVEFNRFAVETRWLVLPSVCPTVIGLALFGLSVPSPAPRSAVAAEPFLWIGRPPRPRRRASEDGGGTIVPHLLIFRLVQLYHSCDALDDLGEWQAAQHCRRGGHVKGCAVLDWIAGRR